jgi:hypothetical protein
MSTKYPMCDSCSLEINKAQWANYPDMLDACKMCKSFQSAIYKTIEDYQKILNETRKDISSL